MESVKKRKSQVPSMTLALFVNALSKVSDEIIDSVDLTFLKYELDDASNTTSIDALRQIIVNYLNAKTAHMTNNATTGFDQQQHEPPHKAAKLSKHHRNNHQMNGLASTSAGSTPTLAVVSALNSKIFNATNVEMFAHQPMAWMRFCNLVMAELIVELETKSIVFQFPKEMLKYFMATAHRFIKPMDFSETGQIAKGTNNNNNNNNTASSSTSNGGGRNTASAAYRKSLTSASTLSGGNSNKHSSNLTNGTILNEYGKGLDVFIAAMSRSDNSDISALKQIIKRPFCIDPKLYGPIINTQFKRPQLLVDVKSMARNDYAQISFTNHKQMFVMLTAHIVMVHDNQQFVVPSSIVEREFTWTIKQTSKLSRPDDYVILDVLIASKVKVIDLLAYSHEGNTTLPDSYEARLNLVKTLVPNIQIATFTTNTNSGSTVGTTVETAVAAIANTMTMGNSSSATNANLEPSYISKPLHGFGPTYIYNKYNLTAAAVGISGKAVVLAFFENNELTIKSKTSIVGPLSYLLTVKPTQPPIVDVNDQTIVNIEHNGTMYRVKGDVRDVQFFTSVLPVELKDVNRLGCISDREISLVSDYKPVVVRRETVVYDDIKHTILQNASVLFRIFEEDEMSSVFSRDKLSQIRAILQPDIETPI